MSLLTDLLRPYWLPGIHEVTGKQVNGFARWVQSDDYQIYTPLTTERVVLSVSTPTRLVTALAADCNRMATASLESLEGLGASTVLPKSIAWVLIRSYYSAFFAAHAILRMFGRSCTQLDGSPLARVEKLADIYGVRGGITLARGQYGGVVDVPGKEIVLQKRSGTDGGSHGAMWGMFVDLLRDLTENLLNGSASAMAAQPVAAKLIELEQVLTAGGGAGSGSWLSQIRNRANYQMAFGAWFPYTERGKYYDTLLNTTNLWQRDPMSIQLWGQKGRDLQRFMEASMLIVAICRVLSQDMAFRCPKGKSFHQFGVLALLSRIGQA